MYQNEMTPRIIFVQKKEIKTGIDFVFFDW